jgi:hypothetical protein
VNETWAVIIPEGGVPGGGDLELMTHENAVENAKFKTKETGVRWNVYKLVQTHTFAGHK